MRTLRLELQSGVLLATCLAGAASFQLAPAPRLPSARRSSPRPWMAEQATEEATKELTALVCELAGRGVAKAELEDAFGAAIAAAYAPPVPSVPAPPKILGELRPPATASDAQAAFREAYSGRFTSSETQRFISVVIGDRAAAFTFRYERVYAVGLAALCDAFLPATCLAPEVDATRAALCFSLGLDEAQLMADAAALTEQAARMTKEELLASDDLQQIAAQANFKFTYVFGVGLVTLMKAVGEELTMKGSLGTWYQAPVGDDGPISAWCAELGLDRVKNRLAADTAQPLSIDRVGTFAFPGLVLKGKTLQ